MILDKKLNCFFRHIILLAQTSEKSTHFTQDTGVKYFSVLKAVVAAISMHISLSQIYSSWRQDAVLAEPAAALPDTV